MAFQDDRYRNSTDSDVFETPEGLQAIEIKSGSTQGVGTRFEVYGTLSNWSASGFTLTSGDTVYRGVLTAQTRIEQEHGLVGNGQFVEVKGYMSGGQFVAVKLEVKRAGVDHD